MRYNHIKRVSPRIHRLLTKEIKRQQETLDFIASENAVSLAVLEALGSPLTNKYSEGYPGRRYYPGNVIYDAIEREAQDLARKVFGLSSSWHVNVQPYSGSPANIAVYAAFLNPGDTLMGMALAHGGHLTHGHRVNFSGKLYRVVQYGLSPKDGRIDYDEVRRLARRFRPKIIVSGATAYPRAIDFRKFHRIAREVGAVSMADIAHIAGLIVAKLHPSPFPFTDVVTMTTHKTLRGPRSAVIICKAQFAEQIDKAVFPGLQGGAHNHVTCAKAVAFVEALTPAFRSYQRQIVRNAKALAESFRKRKFHLITGGTDNHLLLIDVRSKGLTGSEAEALLEEAGIIANRNTIPGDESPFRPSGIRLGTPAVTTRGLREREMRMIAEWVDRLFTQKESSKKTRKEVIGLARRFPLPY